MIDVSGATLSAISLIGDKSGFKDLQDVNLPYVTSKAAWLTQIVGSYDLMFPQIHTDYPTRQEVYEAINLSFTSHHASNRHQGKRSVNTFTRDAKTTPVIPREKQVQSGISVRAASPVNAIGYGTEG